MVVSYHRRQWTTTISGILLGRCLPYELREKKEVTVRNRIGDEIGLPVSLGVLNARPVILTLNAR